MNHGFDSQIWKSVNTIVNNRLFSKFLEPVRYLSLDGTLYEIPVFQPTDYGSIPEIFWGAPLFLNPYGWYCLSVSGHDSAYQNLLLVVSANGSKQLARLTRDKCDALLNEMMHSQKPNPTLLESAQMRAIIEGLTIGGWHAFKSDRE